MRLRLTTVQQFVQPPSATDVNSPLTSAPTSVPHDGLAFRIVSKFISLISTVNCEREPANYDENFSRSTDLLHGLNDRNQLGGNFFTLGITLQSPLKLGAKNAHSITCTLITLLRIYQYCSITPLK